MKKAERPTILLVGPLPPPPGGIATAVATLLGSSLVEDFRFVHSGNSSKRPVNKKGKIDVLNMLNFISQVFSLVVNIVVHRPKLVQIETASGISFLKSSVFVLLSKVARRQVLISIHASGAGFIGFSQALPVLGRWYVRYVLSRSAVVRVESELWVEAFLSEFELDGGKVRAIPNAVRPEEFGVNTARTHYPEKSVTLLFLGWVGEAKGIFDLLDSVELLAHGGHEFKLLVLGPEMREGDLEKVRKAVADKALDTCTEILGERGRSEVVEAYHAADVYVLPSHSEGLPLSILEAMAAGLPVVSTRVGAIPGVIEEGINGFLVSPGDVVGLASAIEALMKDGALRARMAENNRLKIREEYSLVKHVERFKALYWSLLRN